MVWKAHRAACIFWCDFASASSLHAFPLGAARHALALPQTDLFLKFSFFFIEKGTEHSTTQKETVHNLWLSGISEWGYIFTFQLTLSEGYKKSVHPSFLEAIEIFLNRQPEKIVSENKSVSAKDSQGKEMYFSYAFPILLSRCAKEVVNVPHDYKELVIINIVSVPGY
jgi:hypothetical protein